MKTTPAGSSDAELTEAVLLLHSLATDPEDVARRLHISAADVRFIVRHGRIPQKQLTLAWAEDMDLQR